MCSFITWLDRALIVLTAFLFDVHTVGRYLSSQAEGMCSTKVTLCKVHSAKKASVGRPLRGRWSVEVQKSAGCSEHHTAESTLGSVQIRGQVFSCTM